MSIQNEINRISANVASAYNAVAAKGGTIPAAANSDNLPSAVSTIPEVPNPLPIANGGTGGTTAIAAVVNLIDGLGTISGGPPIASLVLPMQYSGSTTNPAGKMTLASLALVFNNRNNSVASSNTAYTSYMTRGIQLATSAPTSMNNGTVSLIYT